MKTTRRLLVATIGLAIFNVSTVVVEAQFIYTTNNGTVTITGYYPIDWAGPVTIPSSIDGLPVTRIGYSAFSRVSLQTGQNTYRLTTVTVPDSVTNIESYAFYQSPILNSVTIGSGVKTIGEGAFSWCGTLERVIFQGDAPSLGSFVFGFDSNATIYYLPGTTGWGPIFGDRPTVLWDLQIHFDYTTNNGAITITGYKGLGEVIVPDTINGLPVTRIADSAFANTPLTSVTIPDSVTNLGNYTFQNCARLTNAAIGTGIASIGLNAFLHCASLTSLTLPNCVTGIANYAFAQCARLANINMGTNVISIGNGAFADCASLASLTIPDSVTNLGDYALQNCTSLASVTIGSSVTRIGTNAFYQCSSLTSVAIPNSVTSIAEEAFYSCTKLTIASIPDSVTNIGWAAFSSCRSLISATIPKSLTSIAPATFEACNSLASVAIPNGVTSIEWDAFGGCTRLLSVIIPSSVTNIGAGAFRGCGSLSAITVESSNPVYCSADGVLFNKNKTTLIQYPGGKTGSYIIPKSVTTLTDAFQECLALTNATIPNSVTKIGDAAFHSCTSLASMMIPDSVVSIGSGAFYGCTSLDNLTIPSSVISIGSGAFGRCDCLVKITVDMLNSAYSSVAGVLFNKSQTTLIQCPGAKAGSYTVPNSVTNIGYDAFFGCNGLTAVTIGCGVIRIGDYAFQNCASLTSVTIGSGVINIGNSAFSYCANLTGVYFQGNAPAADPSVLTGDDNARVYYLPGTTGWGAMFAGRPTNRWNPQVQTGDASFGVRSNQFGFNIIGTANIPIVVEATTNLDSPVWSPVLSMTLKNGVVYFSDPRWTNYPGRFYRLRSP